MRNKIDLPKNILVRGIVKLGGYHYWNWKFPFRHFEKETIKVFTENAIYDLDISPVKDGDKKR